MKSGFEGNGKGYSFAGGKDIRAGKSVDYGSEIRVLPNKAIPGPGTYTPKKLILKPKIAYSFGKDGKFGEKIKDEFPKISPYNYSVNKYSQLSPHRAHQGHKFPYATRYIDVSKVFVQQ